VTDEGDAFTLVHRDPREVLSIVKGIQVELYETTGEAELRVAVDYGPIGLERDAAAAAVGIRRGHDVLRNVARIEPLVSPSQVWVTERFKDALERTPSFYHAEPIEADVRPELRSSDGTFNVKQFKPWDGYLMPNGIWLAGNFDGKGGTDLFHAVDGTDRAHVWFSNGDGTFNVTTFTPWEGYAIPNGENSPVG